MIVNVLLTPHRDEHGYGDQQLDQAEAGGGAVDRDQHVEGFFLTQQPALLA